MTDEIASLRNQVNTLISRSGQQHKISNNRSSNLSGYGDLNLTNNRVTTSVRRASSFHGKDFVDNSSYFDKKIDDLRKSNSHQNINLNNDCLQRDSTVTEGLNEKVSWREADRYFSSTSRTNTPAPQTGRASVAKLRAQNAGMVLAKAKLFDECTTTKMSDFTATNATSKRHCRDNANAKRSQSVAKETDVNIEHFKQSCKRTQVSRKQSNKEAKGKHYYPVVSSANRSPQIQAQTITASQSARPLQEHTDKSYRSAQKFEMQSQKLSNKDPISYQISAKDKTINIARDMEIHQKENAAMKVSPLMKVSVDTTSQNLHSYKADITKTPHIKRPLTVKTPKSTKLTRKTPVETRRTPLRATAQLGTPKRQSPKSILKTRTLSMHT